MCVRYNTIDERWERFIRRKGIWVAIKLPPAQHELFPGGSGNFARIGDNDRLELVEGRWGLLPSWKQMPPAWKRGFYNARIEGSEQKSEGIENMAAFRSSFRYRRAVVPIASYYESADMPAAKAAGKYVEVFPEGEEPLFIAALWEPANALSDFPTYTLVTTHSTGELSQVHSRRLARLDDDTIGTWLNPDAPVGLLKEIVQPLDREPIRVEDAEPPKRSPAKKKAIKPEEPTLF